MKELWKARLASAGAVAGVVGVVLAPVAASASSNTASTTVNANVDTSISVSTSGTVNINIVPVSGGAQTSASDSVVVNTTNPTGYNLALKDSDSTLTLANGANTIAASTNTPSTADVLANNTWGFAVTSTTSGVGANAFDATYAVFSNQTTHASKWAGIAATDFQLKSTSAAASNDTTAVWYSAKADTTKPNGSYTDSVTYTATTNN